MANNTLQAFDHQGILVVDSRLIAQQLGIEHDNFMGTVKKYQTQAEQAFGQFLFQTGTVKNSVGAVNKTKYVLLNEDQATFIMSLSRNTAEVVQCKLELVKAFSKAKQLLKAQESAPRRGIGAYSQRVSEGIKNAGNIPDGYWSVLLESSKLLVYVEDELGLPVDRADLLDGSVGIRWANYREGKRWAGDRVKYKYTFPDGRTVSPWAYGNSELLEFRRWLDNDYRPNALPGYLHSKYGALVKA